MSNKNKPKKSVSRVLDDDVLEVSTSHQPTSVKETPVEETPVEEAAPVKDEVSHEPPKNNPIGPEDILGTPFMLQDDDGQYVVISIPTTTIRASKETDSSLNLTPASRSSLPKWVKSIQQASMLNVSEGTFAGHTFSTTEAGIDTEMGTMTSELAPVQSKAGTKVTGRAALIRSQRRTGGGAPVHAVYPHSLINATVLPPTEPELLGLWSEIDSDKITLGRFTYGNVYSAISIVTMRRMINFAIDHVEATSVDLDDNSLQETLLVTDVPFVLNSMGMAMYPKGVQYDAACVAETSTCQHIVTGMLNPEHLARYTTNTLGRSAKAVLSTTGKGTVSLAELKSGRADMSNYTKEQVTFKDAAGDIICKMDFQVPTIAHAITAGEMWVDDIHNAVVQSLMIDVSKDQDDEDWTRRDEMITQHGQAAYMAQYSAWITSIDMMDDGVVTNEDGLDDISGVLAGYSSNDALRKDFMNEIIAFINKASYGTIGVPAYDCPSCHKSSMRAGDIIPLDPVSLFFKYLLKKVVDIRRRNFT